MLNPLSVAGVKRPSPKKKKTLTSSLASVAKTGYKIGKKANSILENPLGEGIDLLKKKKKKTNA